MAIRSSELLAISSPKKWRLLRVNVYFGKALECRCQTTIEGDLLLDPRTHRLYRFVSRKNGTIKLIDLGDRDDDSAGYRYRRLPEAG